MQSTPTEPVLYWFLFFLWGFQEIEHIAPSHHLLTHHLVFIFLWQLPLSEIVFIYILKLFVFVSLSLHARI